MGRKIFHPYGGRVNNPNDAMNVVRHDDELVKLNMGEMGGNLLPTLLGDLPGGVEVHDVVGDFSKKAFSVVGAKGEEICPHLGIVIAP